MANLQRDFTELERMTLGGPPLPEDFGLQRHGGQSIYGKSSIIADYHEAAAAYWRRIAELTAAKNSPPSKGIR